MPHSEHNRWDDQVAEEDHGPIGIFPSWRALYTTVVVYALVLIVVFYLLSQVLSFGGAP